MKRNVYKELVLFLYILLVNTWFSYQIDTENDLNEQCINTEFMFPWENNYLNACLAFRCHRLRQHKSWYRFWDKKPKYLHNNINGNEQLIQCADCEGFLKKGTLFGGLSICTPIEFGGDFVTPKGWVSLATANMPLEKEIKKKSSIELVPENWKINSDELIANLDLSKCSRPDDSKFVSLSIIVTLSNIASTNSKVPKYRKVLGLFDDSINVSIKTLGSKKEQFDDVSEYSNNEDDDFENENYMNEYFLDDFDQVDRNKKMNNYFRKKNKSKNKVQEVFVGAEKLPRSWKLSKGQTSIYSSADVIDMEFAIDLHPSELIQVILTCNNKFMNCNLQDFISCFNVLCKSVTKEELIRRAAMKKARQFIQESIDKGDVYPIFNYNHFSKNSEPLTHINMPSLQINQQTVKNIDQIQQPIHMISLPNNQQIIKNHDQIQLQSNNLKPLQINQQIVKNTDQIQLKPIDMSSLQNNQQIFKNVDQITINPVDLSSLQINRQILKNNDQIPIYSSTNITTMPKINIPINENVSKPKMIINLPTNYKELDIFKNKFQQMPNIYFNNSNQQNLENSNILNNNFNTSIHEIPKIVQSNENILNINGNQNIMKLPTSNYFKEISTPVIITNIKTDHPKKFDTKTIQTTKIYIDPNLSLDQGKKVTKILKPLNFKHPKKIKTIKKFKTIKKTVYIPSNLNASIPLIKNKNQDIFINVTNPITTTENNQSNIKLILKNPNNDTKKDNNFMIIQKSKPIHQTLNKRKKIFILDENKNEKKKVKIINLKKLKDPEIKILPETKYLMPHSQKLILIDDSKKFQNDLNLNSATKILKVENNKTDSPKKFKILIKDSKLEPLKSNKLPYKSSNFTTKKVKLLKKEFDDINSNVIYEQVSDPLKKNKEKKIIILKKEKDLSDSNLKEKVIFKENHDLNKKINLDKPAKILLINKNLPKQEIKFVKSGHLDHKLDETLLLQDFVYIVDENDDDDLFQEVLLDDFHLYKDYNTIFLEKVSTDNNKDDIQQSGLIKNSNQNNLKEKENNQKKESDIVIKQDKINLEEITFKNDSKQSKYETSSESSTFDSNSEIENTPIKTNNETKRIGKSMLGYSIFGSVVLFTFFVIMKLFLL